MSGTPGLNVDALVGYCEDEIGEGSRLVSVSRARS
jgi:hypothetical protein